MTSAVLSRQPCVFTASKLIQFALSILPNHVKRAVILVSLAAKIDKIDSDDEQILHKINATLDLVDNEHSLKMPVLVKNLIWVDTTPVQGELTALRNNVLPTKVLKEYVQSLVGKIPYSLRYAAQETMEADFFKLFGHQTLGVA